MRYNGLVTKVILIILILLAIVGGIFVWQRQRSKLTNATSLIQNIPTQTAEEKTHIHAAFIIFTNGTKRIFTDSKYHERIPEAHLHVSSPSVIHIHAGGITWQEFFDSLPSPMKVTAECLTTGTGQRFCTKGESDLKFYLNGQRAQQSILNQEIRDNDMLLISYGSENENQLREQLKQFPNPQTLNLNPQE